MNVLITVGCFGTSPVPTPEPSLYKYLCEKISKCNPDPGTDNDPYYTFNPRELMDAPDLNV